MEEEAVVPFRINDVDMLVAVTGEAPGETNFERIVSQTFETFGTELQDSLIKSSEVFNKEGDVMKPIVPDETTVTNTSKNSSTLDWTILGSSIAGGICLALIVSLLLVKSRKRRNNDAMVPETTLSDAKSKSFSVSSVREGSSFREYSLIKLVSIEASRSLQKNEEEDDCIIAPPTPMGVDIPNGLENSPADITSEISPASCFGEFACCQNTVERLDTFEGQNAGQNQLIDSSLMQDDQVDDGTTTYATGLSTAMMTNETGTKMSRDHFSSSQSDSSELEGLRLVVSNTNTFSNFESKSGTEPRTEPIPTTSTGKRGLFSFRPTTFLKRRTADRNTTIDDSMDVEDCCANDNWTVKTNSILTPKKANTTSNNSMRGNSSSF
jgi:hypothetical protein